MKEKFIPYCTCTYCNNLVYAKNGKLANTPVCGPECRKKSEERKKYEIRTMINEGLFGPPWNISEFPEKTEGWFEFQRSLLKDPEYYLKYFLDKLDK
jgi:hypothetical protein